MIRAPFQHDIVIVGSGVAGVSAAFPLVEAGVKVLMLDVGREAEGPGRPDMSLTSLLRQPEDSQWRTLLGDNLEGLGDVLDATPKLKVPQFRYVQQGFGDAYGLTAIGVRALGSLAAGGLSNIWGAGTFAYDQADLIGFPIGVEALQPSYAAVAARIGISGASDDDLGSSLGRHALLDPLPLHPAAEAVLARARRKRSSLERFGFTLGRSRNAVITQDRDGRSACKLDKMCLWGCPRGSIYSADQDLRALQARPNFRYRSDCFVHNFRRLPVGGYRLDVGPPGDRVTAESVEAHCLVLAAGAIGTGVLVADALGGSDYPLPILSHPAMAFAFVVPNRIGHAEQERGFALGQLAYSLENDDPQNRAFGVIFSAEGLLAADLALHIPYFTKPAAAAIVRTLQPAMLVANCYVPSDLANCRYTISWSGDRRIVRLEGAHAAGFEQRFHEVKRRISGAMHRLGAWALPGGAKRAQLGSDGHFAGSVPMTISSDRRLSSDAFGEVRGLPGVFVADGAALPRLSGKHPTFTIMANADRIGRHVAAAMAA